MFRFAYLFVVVSCLGLFVSSAYCQQPTAILEDPDFVSSNTPQEFSNYLSNVSGIAAMNSGAVAGLSFLSLDEPAIVIYVLVIIPGGGVTYIPIWVVTPVVTDKFPTNWPVEPNK